MKSPYNVLIVDDHPLIVEGYMNTIKFHNWENLNERNGINLKTAFNIDSALIELKNYSDKNPLDLVLLDISFPDTDKKINTGEDLGLYIREKHPSTNILVLTFHIDVLMISRIFKLLEPEGYLAKGEATSSVLIKAITNIIEGKQFYSQTILDFLTKKSLQIKSLDDYNLVILKELTNGAKMRDLKNFVHLSKSGIEKRIRLMKEHFEVKGGSDRDLILEARRRGFI